MSDAAFEESVREFLEDRRARRIMEWRAARGEYRVIPIMWPTTRPHDVDAWWRRVPFRIAERRSTLTRARLRARVGRLARNP